MPSLKSISFARDRSRPPKWLLGLTLDELRELIAAASATACAR